MPTHQSLSGASDDDLLRRMVATHPDRFDDAFWAFFTASVAPYLPSSPTMLDLGCGPALFLRDLGERYPAATLYGYDVTQAMVTHGRAARVHRREADRRASSTRPSSPCPMPRAACIW